MVGVKNVEPKIRLTYLLKPGQILQNTKPSERETALIIPKSVYDRIRNTSTDNEKALLKAKKEAKKLAARKEASYNMTKNWSDTTHNIQKRRREELLSRRKLEEAERAKFVKEMTVKNALKRAEIVKEAKELLLQRKPQCRLINRALLISECHRELEAQLEFQKANRNLQKKLDEQEARYIMEDVKKFHEEEEKKRQAEIEKIRNNKKELEKQIEKNKSELKKIEEFIKKSELEDMENISKELKELNEKELKEAAEKKEKLQKISLDDIEEKRQYELKLEKENELQEENIKVYKNIRDEIVKMLKQKSDKKIKDRIAKSQRLAKKVNKNLELKRRQEEEKIKNKEEMQKKMEDQQEMEKIKESKRKKDYNRMEMQQQMKNIEEEQEKRKKEESDIKLWETLQRYKRDEFNKDWDLQHKEEERNKRLLYAKILKKQMLEKQLEKRKAMIEDDDSIQVKEIINKSNEKVLAYAEQVLQESRGVRPTYPIEKSIEGFKRDVGLLPFKNIDYEKAPTKMGKRRH